MKKIVSLVLCLMLLLGTVSALADIEITTEEKSKIVLTKRFTDCRL